MRLRLCGNLARNNGVRLSPITIADFKDSFGKSKSVYMEGLHPCGDPRRGGSPGTSWQNIQCCTAQIKTSP